MKIIAAILGGAALIAAAVLFTFRWEVVVPAAGFAYRLDRWTEELVQCPDSSCKAHQWRPVDHQSPVKGLAKDEWDVAFPATPWEWPFAGNDWTNALEMAVGR
jgi:hypothetical protein